MSNKFSNFQDHQKWEATKAYQIGQFVQGSDGNLYICQAINVNDDPTTTTVATNWHLFTIFNSLTINVPSRFPDLSTAADFLSNCIRNSNLDIITINLSGNIVGGQIQWNDAKPSLSVIIAASTSFTSTVQNGTFIGPMSISLGNGCTVSIAGKTQFTHAFFVAKNGTMSITSGTTGNFQVTGTLNAAGKLIYVEKTGILNASLHVSSCAGGFLYADGGKATITFVGSTATFVSGGGGFNHIASCINGGYASVTGSAIAHTGQGGSGGLFTAGNNSFIRSTTSSINSNGSGSSQTAVNSDSKSRVYLSNVTLQNYTNRGLYANAGEIFIGGSLSITNCTIGILSEKSSIITYSGGSLAILSSNTSFSVQALEASRVIFNNTPTQTGNGNGNATSPVFGNTTTSNYIGV